MKIAVIGGGGVRTPLLARGLAQSDLALDEIALYDVDEQRLAAIAPLAATFAPCVRRYSAVRDCVRDAAYVFLSIRVGGIEARARDEAIAIEQGVAGQETIGPGGFAMAMRTIPHAVAYARAIAEAAPQAWIVNFTNPVGIVTQAMMPANARTIGICDTPTELFEEVAHALGVDSSRCRFDYFGLNHLGWLREVYCDGAPRLAAMWDDEERLARIYRAPLFDTAALRQMRLLPTEYLFFYYTPDLALANTRRSARTRGAEIAALNGQLFRDLAAAGAEAPRVYEDYLRRRSAGYMQIESGAPAPLAATVSSSVTGYDKIALDVVHAIHRHTNAVIPLNVPNRGTLRALADDDVVEVPCEVNGNGAAPLTVGAVPAAAEALIVQVKNYERLTIRATTTGAREDAVRALAANPLVGDEAIAARLVDAFRASW